MAKISTNISIDSETKRQAQALFSELGLDLSTAVNLFLRQAVRERGIPFVISAEAPNAETQAAIREVRQMRKSPGSGKTFDSVDSRMEALLADV